MFATNNTSYDPNKWWFYSECKQVSFWYGTFGLLSARNQIPFASKRMRKIICMWSLNLWERYLFFLASLIWIRVDVRLVNELLSTNISIDLDASRNESIFCLNFKWQFLCVVVCVCDAIHHINWSSSHWNIYCFGWMIQLICCSDVFVSSKQTEKNDEPNRNIPPWLSWIHRNVCMNVGKKSEQFNSANKNEQNGKWCYSFWSS